MLGNLSDQIWVAAFQPGSYLPSHPKCGTVANFQGEKAEQQQLGQDSKMRQRWNLNPTLTSLATWSSRPPNNANSGPEGGEPLP